MEIFNGCHLNWTPSGAYFEIGIGNVGDQPVRFCRANPKGFMICELFACAGDLKHSRGPIWMLLMGAVIFRG